MDKQNSEGSSISRLHPFVILQHGIEVKKQIQDEIFKLIAILKKREHDLCLEVDQQCLELLYEAEESEKASAPVLNDPNCKVDTPKQYLKKQDLLTSKLMFTGSFKNSQYLLKTYGHLTKIDCRKSAMSKPTTNGQPTKLWNWWGENEQGNYVSEERFQSIAKNGSLMVKKQAEKALNLLKVPQKTKLDGVVRPGSGRKAFENECIRRDKAVMEKLKKDLPYNQDFQMFKAFAQNSFENEEDCSRSYLKMQVERDAAAIQEIWAVVAEKFPYNSSSDNQTSFSRMPKEDDWLKTKETCPSPACTNSMQKENEWLADAGRKLPETSTDGEMQASSSDSLFVVNPPESSNEQENCIRHTKKVADRATASIKETRTSFGDKNPTSSSSANQTHIYRIPNNDYWLNAVKGTCPSPTCTNTLQKENEWLADARRKLTEISTDGEMENEWLADARQKLTEMSADGEIQASSRDTLFVVSPELSNDSPAEMPGGDNPQNTIKACFGEYLKQDDLELWLSSNRSSDENDRSQSSSENEDFEICNASGSGKAITIDLTDEMIDSFCFIPPESRRKTGNIVATAFIT